MKFFSYIKSGWQKALLYAIPFSTILFIGATHIADAQTATSTTNSGIVGYFTDAILNATYTLIGKSAFAITYIVATIAGLGIAVEAWFVGVILNINTTVFQSAVVQQGFNLSLSIANLGFVIGIIIIAIATILHVETYSYKKILPKLVIAAILVNFSLVIAAPIFSFSNSMTKYFLNCVDPNGGGCSGNNGSFNSLNDFAVTLSSAFNPQKAFIGSNFLNASGSLQQDPNAGAFATSGQDLGKLIVPIFSIFFVAFELIIIAVVLGVFSIQLLIRYVYISILAILMPFAWLGWVFPSMNKWWGTWWDKFIKQTFFAPIVVFFLYLAIQTANLMSSNNTNGSQSFAVYTSSSNNPVFAAIASLGGSALTAPVQNFLNIIVLAGLSIGGMLVADKMGVHLAAAATDAVKKTAKGVGNFALKQSMKAGMKTGRAIYDKGVNIRGRQIIPQGNKITTALKEGNIGPLKHIWKASRLASLAGRGIASISSNADFVEAAKQNVPKDVEEIKSNLRGDMNKEDQLAHIAKLLELGKYTGDEMINGRKASDFLDEDTKNGLIARYGQGKLTADADNAILSNMAMRDAERQITEFGESSKEGTEAMKDLAKATDEFIEKKNKADIAKANVNGALGKNTILSKEIARGIIMTNPELIPNALRKMNKVTLKNFQGQFDDVLFEEEYKIAKDTKLSFDEKDSAFKKLRKKRKDFQKNLGNNVFDFSGNETATPTPTPTPTPHP